jgi:enoyl-CoA hydratase/carnithine racemase
MSRDSHRPSPEEIILYEKDVATKIATITINRPDKHNAITIAARHRFSELVHRANVDDAVKVLVIRGAGDNFGTGDDLPEMADLFSDKDVSWLHDFRIGDDEGVKYPTKGSYRHLGAVTQLYARTGEGMRDLQDFKKISIVEAKGYCYGGNSISPAMPTSSLRRKKRSSAMPPSAMPAGPPGCGNGR